MNSCSCLKKDSNAIGVRDTLCASINVEEWRYHYYHAIILEKFEQMKIKMPTTKVGEIDKNRIKRIIYQTENLDEEPYQS